jgi:hypothetical protein
MSFQVICVLSLLAAGVLGQTGDLGATAGEYVPANEALIYEAGGEKSWNANYNAMNSLSYYFYSVPSSGALIEQELRYVAWASYDPENSGFPNNGNHFEYVVGWTPHCTPGTAGAGSGGNCGFAAYQIDVSQLPTTWSELRVTKPRNFELAFNMPVSVDVGSEFEWDGEKGGTGAFIPGSPDFWYTLWYVDATGAAHQMQCPSTVGLGSGDQMIPPTSSAPGATDEFVYCTDALHGGNSWVPATIPTTYDEEGKTYKLWRVSSGGRPPASAINNVDGSCNVAFLDTDITSGSPTTSSFNDANGKAINKGRIWWGAWSGTSSTSACSGGFVTVGATPPDDFMSVGNGYDNMWAIQDNGDGTTALQYYHLPGASSLPAFSPKSTSAASRSQWVDGGWTATSNPIQVDSYDCSRTYVIDDTYSLWRVSASVDEYGS